MLTVKQQTRDEKLAMYMRCTKSELADMLVNCNDAYAMWEPDPPIGSAGTVNAPHFDSRLTLRDTAFINGKRYEAGVYRLSVVLGQS